MIKTIHQVILGDKVVLETEDARAAKKRDAEIEVAASLLVESEKFIAEHKELLPKGVKPEQLDSLMEELFLHMSENPEGFKRALKGQPFSVQEKKEPTRTRTQKTKA